MLEAYIQALHSFGNLEFVLFVLLGIVIGLIFGIIPGIGGQLAVALLLPFMFTIAPDHGLPLLLAIMSVQFIGGSITAILLNVPGTGPNSATLIDGFPMSLKGEAGQALGAALTSSGIGSIVTSFLALLMVPAVLFIVMAIRSAEMVFIILMGLSFIAVLGRGSTIRGLISGGLGLLLSFIGFQATTGVARFTFGNLYLYDGIPLIPLAMGLFAMPEMIVLAMRGSSISKTGVTIQGFTDIWSGMKDVIRHWRLCLASSLIGYIVGLIPGVGADIATFIAYGQAKQTSKYPDKFGTGIVEGVIAPESANDAKEGGALLTTLALGIPGSSIYAIVLGAMLMMGLTPGPAMLQEHLTLSLSLMLVIASASIIGIVVCLLAAPYLAKIAVAPAHIIFPIVLVFIFAGTFTFRGYFNDIILLLIFTALGLALKSFDCNRPALFLGYILGYLFELYLFRALAVSGPLFFFTPINMTIILIIILLFTIGPTRRLFGHRYKRGAKAV